MAIDVREWLTSLLGRRVVWRWSNSCMRDGTERNATTNVVGSWTTGEEAEWPDGDDESHFTVCAPTGLQSGWGG